MNLDIGGQLNRNDKRGLWKIVDQHPGADYRLNLETERLPFEDGTVDNIYTSHCIEHIEPSRLRPIFADMHRVLKEGGRVRIVVPSFVKGVLMYFFNPRRLWDKVMPRRNSNCPDTKMARLSSWFYTEVNPRNGVPGHKTAWDFELMRAFLTEAGFVNVRKCSLSDCSEIFVGKDNPEYKRFSLYVEAEAGPKPVKAKR